MTPLRTLLLAFSFLAVTYELAVLYSWLPLRPMLGMVRR